jgi:starvation-inducible DNA-binding protein
MPFDRTRGGYSGLIVSPHPGTKGSHMAPTRNGKSTQVTFLPAGLDRTTSEDLVGILQGRLVSLIDLGLTVKHVHWNVVGPHFIGVHQMLDPQYESVSELVDQVAERITTLGGSPDGRPGSLVKQRTWDDYSLERDLVDAHLAALDLVYVGVITSHRDAISATEEIDPVTQDLLIEQTEVLEQFHWFVRAHLEDAGGHLVDRRARSEKTAAASARRATDAPKSRKRTPAKRG